MPFVVDPQPGEEVYLHKQFRGSHDHVFALAVSNQAVYLPVQKLVLKRDPWFFKRVPLSDVLDVRLLKQRPLSLILLSAAMIIVGTVLSLLMMWRAFQPDGGRALQKDDTSFRPRRIEEFLLTTVWVALPKPLILRPLQGRRGLYKVLRGRWALGVAHSY